MPPNERKTIAIGKSVYDDSGNQLGTIRGFNEDGFFVTAKEGIAGLSRDHERTVPEHGEAYLVWRCSDCGEVGDVEEFPESCPSCGAPREHLYYCTED